VRRGLAVLLLLIGAAVSAAAQDAALTVSLQSGVPRIQAVALLANGKFVGLMRSGFPLRLHYRLELWRTRSGWFDDHVSESAWDAVANYDPLADDFVLIRSGGLTARYARVDALAQALQLPYKVTLSPKDAGKFYYLCRLEVSTLNDTDLQEVEQWLKGQVTPAVSGRGDLTNAMVRGAQRLLVRIAGLPRLTLEARSETFKR
jgi:Domain of unknown function (DUF4390)